MYLGEFRQAPNIDQTEIEKERIRESRNRERQVVLFIGPQGTSMCSRGPRVHRIPYKSGLFFYHFL
jgi:hypothetical protein